MELKKARKVNVFILGHSIGVSDKLILSDILKHKEIYSIVPFYYKDRNGYLDNQINIDRIIDDYSKTKEEKMNFGKLKRYSECHAMLQHDSTEQEKVEFIDYVRKISSDSINLRRSTYSF